MIKCRFCQAVMLPNESVMPDSDTEYRYCTWDCHNCPSTVRQSADDKDWFAILTFYNGHWFEIMQMYTESGSKDPPLLSIYKLTPYTNDAGNISVKSEFVMELNVNGNITPQNIKDKLAVILTFS